MFRLKNKIGTAIIIVKSEHHRDRLIRRGWCEIEEATEGFNLSAMKVDELKAFAAEHNIDISASKNKAEIIEVINKNI